ncbi:MAG: DUF1501 domain-containing protein [Dokdonella sp.]|uniref:DUF1501 domain-containing protein n=1 Tax=Dokdonella sp. TaxID=2291710 RepID=UPI0025BD3B5E|nr:DUF1501 domain-containing protein [Dokdonella sp.]MBX3699604.1 DUF1501 domain-containing protein [Dokdonella sp.]MCW5577365.1 DUF1501 domain-containing protein [Dokdonella sp.]
MSQIRQTRRDFLRGLAAAACCGGVPALFPQLRMIGTALAGTRALTGYKALVCVYLSGGNDSWNMLVPYDAARHAVYATSRGGVYNASGNPGGLALPLPTGSQIPLQTIVDAATTGDVSQYFMHRSLERLAAIYRANKLAFAVNVGPLVRPITMADYATSSNRPPQLFSHSDQENLWHQANTTAGSVRGWGGRSGDIVRSSNANQDLSPCISIAGANRFEIGFNTVPYQMSSSGLTALSGMCNPTPCSGVSATSVRDNALNAMLEASYESDLAGEYAKVFGRGRDLYNLLKAGLDATTLATTFPSGNTLAAQLQTVAKLIKLSRQQNYAARQIYYVRYGGFDLHAGLMSGGNSDHAALLANVDAALGAFWDALGPGDINSRNEVTVFSASEFARTLQSNGSGSDHGWGGVQFAFGGAVNGGRLYSDGGGPISGFPNQSLTAPNNFSRGQMIPGISVDQYAATLAQWLGVTAPADLAAIFPNLAQFGSSNLGFV